MPGDGEEIVLATGVGFDEETVQVDVYTVEVRADKTELAAGAIDTEPHRTVITVEVTPGDPWVQVDLSIVGGGLGYTGEEGAGESYVNWHGPAKLDFGGGRWLPAGDPPMSGTTDETGSFTVNLISSNMIEDSCAVYAQCGDEDDTTPTITFKEGTTEFPAVDFFLGGTFEKTVTRLGCGDEPLDGHLMVIHVASVTVAGAKIEPSDDEWRNDFEGCKHRLAPYAEPCIPYRLATGTDGKARVSISVADNEDIEGLETRCLDLSIHP